MEPVAIGGLKTEVPPPPPLESRICLPPAPPPPPPDLASGCGPSPSSAPPPPPELAPEDEDSILGSLGNKYVVPLEEDLGNASDTASDSADAEGENGNSGRKRKRREKKARKPQAPDQFIAQRLKILENRVTVQGKRADNEYTLYLRKHIKTKTLLGWDELKDDQRTSAYQDGQHWFRAPAVSKDPGKCDVAKYLQYGCVFYLASEKQENLASLTQTSPKLWICCCSKSCFQVYDLTGTKSASSYSDHLVKRHDIAKQADHPAKIKEDNKQKERAERNHAATGFLPHLGLPRALPSAGSVTMLLKASDPNIGNLEKKIPVEVDRSRLKSLSLVAGGLSPVVLVACGSYSPPTVMHTRIFETARDFFQENKTSLKIDIIGGFLSPVHAAYGKQGLAPMPHRVEMVKRALASSDWVNCDEWETKQNEWTLTATVLSRMHIELNKGNTSGKEIKAMLLCGADILDSMVTPGVWSESDLRTLLARGIVCIKRAGSDPEKLINEHDLLHQYRNNIYLIREWVENNVSSTAVRRAVKRGKSIKYFVAEAVMHYIKEKKLYLAQD